MLVLSRNPGDGISFPDLDLVIEILKVQGKRVQLGVTASDTIRILRSELCEREREVDATPDAKRTHSLRNELNALSIGLSVAEKYLQRGDVDQAEQALERVMGQLRAQHEPLADQGAMTTGKTTDVVRESQHHGRVLIVEDNANESQLLGQILQLNGFEVHSVFDGNQAIAWLETNTPDVILMDMHMAQCDGPTAVRRIRALPRLRSIPILAVSGADRATIQAESPGDLEVQDWFQKPVKAQPLMSAIDDLVTQAMRF